MSNMNFIRCGACGREWDCTKENHICEIEVLRSELAECKRKCGETQHQLVRTSERLALWKGMATRFNKAAHNDELLFKAMCAFDALKKAEDER